ncbi:hypothetical protein G7Y89_g3572 [Cudoniella acicularis]|uniref:Uncharacterized protein n=1 Tax=Cudoniella acicularis TaxID=354080 RepID=A0A8H4RR38_9HELO|nr:hypothetical protein G7Y89_g3572 [Cudoniella acicularis]
MTSREEIEGPLYPDSLQRCNSPQLFSSASSAGNAATEASETLGGDENQSWNCNCDCDAGPRDHESQTVPDSSQDNNISRRFARLVNGCGSKKFNPSQEPTLEKNIISGLRWKPRSLKAVLWSALGALILAFLSTILCIVVLVAPDHKPVEEWPSTLWPVSPSVLLAICSATVNISLGFAFSEGVNISWWTCALRGTTIKELQNLWLFGNSFVAAMKKGRSFSRMALATIVVTAVTIDDPLLQRASTTILMTSNPGERIVNLTLATHLPFGYTGFQVVLRSGQLANQQAILTDRFQQVIQAYSQRRPIPAITFSGCRGTCNGTVCAVGHPTSLNPLETAEALNAPLLRVQYSNYKVNTTATWSCKIRYGEVIEMDDMVDGAAGDEDMAGFAGRKRLVMAHSHRVGEPIKGTVYY